MLRRVYSILHLIVAISVPLTLQHGDHAKHAHIPKDGSNYYWKTLNIISAILSFKLAVCSKKLAWVVNNSQALEHSSCNVDCFDGRMIFFQVQTTSFTMNVWSGTKITSKNIWKRRLASTAPKKSVTLTQVEIYKTSEMVSQLSYHVKQINN